MDISGNRPEIYLITSNRTDGKSTYFARKAVNAFKRKGHQFMYVTRFKDQVKTADVKIFEGIKQLFFREDSLNLKSKENGIYAELYLNGDLCGYAAALNTQSKLKESSAIFHNVKSIWLDEFQTLDRYCPDEVRKLLDLHYTVARGKGEAYRYVPIYLTGNHLDLFNPYYMALKIPGRLKADTHYMRGEGWVLEQNINKSVLEARQLSGLTRAFQGEEHLKRDAYLYEDLVCMPKPSGYSKYLVTLKYNGREYAIYDYGYCAYFTSQVDSTFKVRAAITATDIDESTPHINMMPFIKDYICRLLKLGNFRFKDPECKKVCFDIFLNLR